jgi:predicted permease
MNFRRTGVEVMQGFLTNIIIFIVIGLGWLMKKRGILTDAGLRDINAMLFTLLMPVSFFKSGLGFNTSMLRGWRYVAVLLGSTAVCTVFLWVYSGFAHKDPKRRAVSLLTGIRSNLIFIGLPIMTLWLGQAGSEAQVLYIAVCTPYANIVPLLLAQVALNGRADRTSIVHACVQTFKNPILLSGIVGIAVGAAGAAPLLPQWLMRTLKVLGDCSTGLALIVIGAALHPENLLKDMVAAWHDLLMKLFIYPAVVMGAFMLFPLGNALLMRAAVVASAVSPAFNCYILARGFGMDGDYAAMLVASSTLLCMVTTLFWMSLTSAVFV